MAGSCSNNDGAPAKPGEQRTVASNAHERVDQGVNSLLVPGHAGQTLRHSSPLVLERPVLKRPLSQAPPLAPSRPNSSFSSTPKPPSNLREGTPSRSLINQAFPSPSDVLPSPSLFDATILQIKSMVQIPSLSEDEQLSWLSEILKTGTKAISVAHLGNLLCWPPLRSAWMQFVHDVLEYHPPGYTTSHTSAPNPYRFSSFLDLPSGTDVLALEHGTRASYTPTTPTTTSGHSHPKWRVIPEPSTTRVAMQNIRRAITGREPFTPDPHLDLGLPSISLLARQLLAGMNQAHTPDLQHTSPVNRQVLAQWTSRSGTSQHVHQRHSDPGTAGWVEQRRERTIEDYYARFVLVCLDAVYHPVLSTSGAGDGNTTTSAGGRGLPNPGTARGTPTHRPRRRPVPTTGTGAAAATKAGAGSGARVHVGSRNRAGRLRRSQETSEWRERMAWLRDPKQVGGVPEQTWILVHVLLFLHLRKREEIIRAGKGMTEGKGFMRGLFCWRG